VFHQGDQRVLDRAGRPRVAQHHGHGLLQVQSLADLVRLITGSAVEAVERDDERQAAHLEVIHRREAVIQAADIREHHSPERPVGKLVPHEPEPLLAWDAEQVEHQLRAQAEAAVVKRDRRRRLARDPVQIVVADAGGGQPLLGEQRPDLADGGHHRGLPGREAARDEELVRREAVRVPGGH
jgi:hypothetical protein